MPEIGERTPDPKPLEWTGAAWTAVCTTCDKPMNARNREGWLCCGGCGLKAVDR